VKRATVRGRRTDPTGRRLVNVVCPVCDGRHWLPADPSGQCPRPARRLPDRRGPKECSAVTAHCCDPLTGGQGGPITIARVLRIVLARLDVGPGRSA
jgi:hypothetical protein